MAAAMPLLHMRGICKFFPGVRALDQVDFTLGGGEIHALLGENGAGKSTLIKVLTGVYRRDGGEILLAGQPIVPRSPAHAQALGISTVYQEINLIPNLSVAENISLGREPRRWGHIGWHAVNERAVHALARLDVGLDVSRPLGDFSVALQQLVAIARALDVAARILILDEPTSSLAEHEVERLFGVLRRLKGQGLGIVFITHFLGQVYAVADRMTVLRNGKLVGAYEPAQLPPLELVAKMLGREVEAVAQAAPRSAGTRSAIGVTRTAGPLLRARRLGRTGRIAPLDLGIDAGEIVGLAGLLGSGRTETARLLFGLDRPSSGELEIDGRRVVVRSPRQAIRHGIGFCPEDRKTEGLFAELSVRENIVVALQARRGWFRRLSGAAQRARAEQYMRALGIAATDVEKPVAQLSGGNQQKVILARWLAAQPRLLILDEPLRGIDVGAKAEIERLIGELAGRGLAILLISSELEEIARNAVRVVVLRDRAKVGELAGDQVTPEAMMKLIAEPT